ncbi:MAG: hypothetical protein H5T97_09875 [Firmicutes bacterium]|nr:hypothetical protein [Bacillota bacterium]
MSKKTKGKRGVKGAKAALARAIARLQRLWPWDGELPEEAVRLTAEILAAAVQSNLEAGADVFYVQPHAVVAVHPSGETRVFVWAPQLEEYADAGFPLPEGVDPGSAELLVVGLEIGIDFTALARPLGRALARFPWVTLTGIDPQTGRYGAADARENLRRMARAIAKHKSPANLVREASREAGEPLDLDLLRDISAFWRDFCEGRVAL